MLRDIGRLRRIISAPQNSSCSGNSCPLSDEVLYELLTRFPCYELAAYHACVMLAQEDSLRLPDGTDIPSQRQYWLNRARQLRPSRGRIVARADEVKK